MVEVTDKVRCNNCMSIFDEDTIECGNCNTDQYFMQPFGQTVEGKCRQIKDGKEIIEAIDFLVENELDPQIETIRLLNGGAFTRYTWRLHISCDNIELLYMDETTIIPRSDFENVWREEYAKGMYYPPLDGGKIILLGDSISWVGDLAVTVYQLDHRLAEHIVTSDKGYKDVDHYPALAEPTHSLEDLIDSVGSFNQSEITTLFEIARFALGDAGIFDDVCSDMDIANLTMKKLQEKLEAHMETQRVK